MLATQFFTRLPASKRQTVLHSQTGHWNGSTEASKTLQQRDEGANNHQPAKPQASLYSAQLTKQERRTNCLPVPPTSLNPISLRKERVNIGGVEIKHEDRNASCAWYRALKEPSVSQHFPEPLSAWVMALACQCARKEPDFRKQFAIRPLGGSGKKTKPPVSGSYLGLPRRRFEKCLAVWEIQEVVDNPHQEGAEEI